MFFSGPVFFKENSQKQNKKTQQPKNEILQSVSRYTLIYLWNHKFNFTSFPIHPSQLSYKVQELGSKIDYSRYVLNF